VVGPVEVYLPLAGLVNIDEERLRLQKDLAETQAQIERLEKLLGSSFAEKSAACRGAEGAGEAGGVQGNGSEDQGADREFRVRLCQEG